MDFRTRRVAPGRTLPAVSGSKNCVVLLAVLLRGLAAPLPSSPVCLVPRLTLSDSLLDLSRVTAGSPTWFSAGTKVSPAKKPCQPPPITLHRPQGWSFRDWRSSSLPLSCCRKAHFASIAQLAIRSGASGTCCAKHAPSRLCRGTGFTQAAMKALPSSPVHRAELSHPPRANGDHGLLPHPGSLPF